jgi:hypothetical protein
MDRRERSAMLCFEVMVNGTSLCRAGIGASGVLSATVSWVGGSPQAERAGGRTKEGETELRVGGLYSTEREQVFPEWVARVLAPGDEVVLRVVEADSVDPPSSQAAQSHDWLRKHEKAYYERMKRKYERNPKKKRAEASDRRQGRTARSKQSQRARPAKGKRRGPRR